MKATGFKRGWKNKVGAHWCKVNARGVLDCRAYASGPIGREFRDDCACNPENRALNTSHCEESRWAARPPRGVARCPWGVWPHPTQGRRRV